MTTKTKDFFKSAVIAWVLKFSMFAEDKALSDRQDLLDLNVESVLASMNKDQLAVVNSLLSDAYANGCKDSYDIYKEAA